MYQFSPNHHFPSVDHHFLPENGPETGQNPWISLEITARRWREPPSNWTWSPTAQYLSGKHLAAAAFFLRRKDDCWVVILGFTYFFWVVGCYRVIIYICSTTVINCLFFFFGTKWQSPCSELAATRRGHQCLWKGRSGPAPTEPNSTPRVMKFTKRHDVTLDIFRLLESLRIFSLRCLIRCLSEKVCWILFLQTTFSGNRPAKTPNTSVRLLSQALQWERALELLAEMRSLKGIAALHPTSSSFKTGIIENHRNRFWDF